MKQREEILIVSFEKITKYADDQSVRLPERATAHSAGYDFCAAEDTIIPSYSTLMEKLSFNDGLTDRCPWDEPRTLEETAEFTKGFRPTLIPTGIKCNLCDDEFLELSVRSSGPLKHWIILANGVGIIDADYYNNPDNEGHIYFQVINLLPFPIKILKGDKIGQGVILRYETVAEDTANGERTGGFGSTDA